MRARILAGNRSQMPEIVRIRLALYSQWEEIDRHMEALEEAARTGYAGRYAPSQATGNSPLSGEDRATLVSS